jgi:hypothetical protein
MTYTIVLGDKAVTITINVPGKAVAIINASGADWKAVDEDANVKLNAVKGVLELSETQIAEISLDLFDMLSS